MLQTGFQFLFDGAQGDAVARCKNGRAIPYNAGKNLAQQVAETLLQTQQTSDETSPLRAVGL